MAKNTSVLGIYPDRTSVANTVNVLHNAGFRATDISVLASDNEGSKDFALEKHNQALAGAATGAAACAVVGAILAWFVSTQILPVAGLAPLVAAGPLLAALAGAGAGATLGWIVGFLSGLGQLEYVAKRYAGRMRRAGILLSVHCDSQVWCARAKKILEDTGALDIDSAAESAADYATTDKPTKRTSAAMASPVVVPPPETTECVVHETTK
jgi:hypothetical protein